MPLTDTTTLSDLPKGLEALRIILRLIFRHARLYFVIMILLSLGIGLLPIVQVRAMATLIDRIAVLGQNPSPSADWIWQTFQICAIPLITLIGLLQVRNIVNAVQLYVADCFREQTEPAIHATFHRKFLSLSLADFERHEILDLGNTSIDTSYKLANFWKNDFQNFLSNVFSLLAIIGIFFVTGYWSIALLLFIGSVPEIVLHLSASQERHLNYFWRMRAIRRSDYWSELLTKREASAELRLYGLQDLLLGRWRHLRTELNREEAGIRNRLMRKIMLPVVFNHIILGASFFVLLNSALEGQLEPGLFLALIFSLQQFQTALSAIPQDLFHLLIFIAEMQYMGKFLNLPEQDLQSQARPMPTLKQGITLENVSFAYPDSEHNVLHDISLKIRPGERIAIVGENGAGKTTLAKLVLGLYTPTSGRVLLDGTERSDSTLAAWRASCGAVFQDFMRFPFTVRENIGFGNLEHLDNLPAIEAAAKLSTASAFIDRLPRGYETLLQKEFEGGQDLSYGQWQKLAIARAYLRDAQMLVLDEPARALDSHAEYEVYQRFRDLSAGRTILLISHRVGSARLADRILVLQQGRIAEQGTHEELLTLNGSYAQLYRMQAKWYQEKLEEDHIYEY